MSERTTMLLGLVDCGYSGRSWHGTSLEGTLRGLTPEVAVWVAADGRRSIWELLLHAAYWKYIVRRALTGGPENTFGRGPANWPALPDERTVSTLEADIAFVGEEHQRLLDAVAAFDPARWDEAAQKSGGTYLGLVQGVAFHDIHHGGQIQLLKRLHAAS